MNEIISELLKSNEFFSGGLLLMVFGTIVGAVYKIVPPLKKYITRKFTISIQIRDDELFEWLEMWLSRQSYGKTCKLLSARVDWITKDNRSIPDVVFSPGRGSHFFRYDNRWFWLEREKESEGKDKGNDIQAALAKEVFSIRTYGRDTKVIRTIIEDVKREAVARDSDEFSVFFPAPWGDGWQRAQRTSGRSLDSVILDEKLKNEIKEDISTFLNSREWYENFGIPYRRGYLLYGPPGTGKSSLVKALATHFQMDLYVLNLANKMLTDTKLINLLNDTKPRSLVLLEDIDTIFEQREKKVSSNDNSVTFSGVLNALDGVATQEGRVTFMTTNHMDRLDPALIRDGRADFKKYIGHASKEQARNYFLRFYEGEHQLATEFSNLIENDKVTMAEIQNHLLKHRDVAEDAVRNWAYA